MSGVSGCRGHRLNGDDAIRERRRHKLQRIYQLLGFTNCKEVHKLLGIYQLLGVYSLALGFFVIPGFDQCFNRLDRCGLFKFKRS
jgi:hypothetical protein